MLCLLSAKEPTQIFMYASQAFYQLNYLPSPGPYVHWDIVVPSEHFSPNSKAEFNFPFILSILFLIISYLVFLPRILERGPHNLEKNEKNVGFEFQVPRGGGG